MNEKLNLVVEDKNIINFSDLPIGALFMDILPVDQPSETGSEVVSRKVSETGCEQVALRATEGFDAVPNYKWEARDGMKVCRVINLNIDLDDKPAAKQFVHVLTGEIEQAGYVSEDRWWRASELRKDGKPDCRKHGHAKRVVKLEGTRYFAGQYAEAIPAREDAATAIRERIKALTNEAYRLEQELFALYASK